MNAFADADLFLFRNEQKKHSFDVEDQYDLSDLSDSFLPIYWVGTKYKNLLRSLHCDKTKI